jgi:hypothetical protein
MRTADILLEPSFPLAPSFNTLVIASIKKLNAIHPIEKTSPATLPQGGSPLPFHLTRS